MTTTLGVSPEPSEPFSGVSAPPVFVDPTGRRHRVMQVALSLAALAAAAPMVVAAAELFPL